MARVSIEGEQIFGEGVEVRSGSFETNPIDIGRATAWSLQFKIEEGAGGGEVSIYASSGNTDAWAQLGETYPLEDGMMIRDSVAPYRFVKAEVMGASGTISAILTMVV